jgi:fatty-acyl-CoA synthase
MSRRRPAVTERLRDELRAIKACHASGFLERQSLADTGELLRAQRRFGPLGGAVVGARMRHGRRTALIDDRGALSFDDVDERSTRLANAWRERGVAPGAGIGILVRNHRGFYDAFFACAKLGARAVLLNTDFAAPQLRETCARESVRGLVYDDEFDGIVAGIECPLGLSRAWAEDSTAPDTLDALIAGGSPVSLPRPTERSSFVILTSGTTGAPKGANRAPSRTLTPVGALLERVPFRARETTVIVPPLFHSLGFTHAMLGLGLGSTVVLQRRFDPPATLDALVEHRASAVIVVPSVLRRLLDELDERGPRATLPDLRVVFVAGSQLGGSLARRAAARLGDVVYNLYGSTEVAIATIATPDHLRMAPDTVGPPALGSRVRIVDGAGHPVPAGSTGRIVVGNAIPFSGYTDGAGKPEVDGLIASGDVGHLDHHGWLHIDGRDDAMIVSGGENVFPDEIENLLAGHPAIAEAAAIGVDDERFGQRLCVFVVTRPGATIDADEVRAHVRENLARYKVPRDVIFVEGLPRNPTGKVLKRALAELAVDLA